MKFKSSPYIVLKYKIRKNIQFIKHMIKGENFYRDLKYIIVSHYILKKERPYNSYLADRSASDAVLMYLFDRNMIYHRSILNNPFLSQKFFNFIANRFIMNEYAVCIFHPRCPSVFFDKLLEYVIIQKSQNLSSTYDLFNLNMTMEAVVSLAKSPYTSTEILWKLAALETRISILNTITNHPNYKKSASAILNSIKNT